VGHGIGLTRMNGYFLRMNEERIPKKALNMNMKGK
jgi:hypothetical protein